MNAPVPFDLATYARDFAPDLEVKPRTPVFAVGLVSAKGVPFVLVREATGEDAFGGMLAWLVWREHDCVGYVGATTAGHDPFALAQRIATPRMVRPERAVHIWRSFIADGTGRGTGGDVLARVPSRGLGIMTRAYVEIVRQLSNHGSALSSNPKARSAEAKALWERLRATAGIEIVKRRMPSGGFREFAFMSASAREIGTPGPIRQA